MPKSNKFTNEFGFELVLETLVTIIPRNQPVKRLRNAKASKAILIGSGSCLGIQNEVEEKQKTSLGPPTNTCGSRSDNQSAPATFRQHISQS